MAIHIHLRHQSPGGSRRRVLDSDIGTYVGRSGRVYTAEELKKDFRTVHVGVSGSKGYWHPDVGYFTIDRASTNGSKARDGVFSEIVELLEVLWHRHAAKDADSDVEKWLREAGGPDKKASFSAVNSLGNRMANHSNNLVSNVPGATKECLAQAKAAYERAKAAHQEKHGMF